MVFRKHALNGLLGDQKGTERADRDCALHVLCNELEQRTARSRTCVVYDDVWCPDIDLDIVKETLYELGRHHCQLHHSAALTR